MTEIFGASTVNDNLAIDDIENERQTLIGLLVDESGSMGGYQSVMSDCLQKFKQALKDSKQEDEILVSYTGFDDNIRSGGYQLIDDLLVNYHVGGMTALYDAIVDAQVKLFDGNGNGYQEQLRANGIKTKGVVAIFSDGQDNSSQASLKKARQAVQFLQSQEIVVAFIAFGDDAHGIAQDLGIDDQNILEVSASESELRRVFAVLSKSAISASMSAATGASSNAFFV
ncbi:hypothetical protein FWF48_00355 [Candidatus Saccharibacteria bacterium]|nr:hypothetical protein [Candidatus Saccharibacteria bacterium]